MSNDQLNSETQATHVSNEVIENEGNQSFVSRFALQLGILMVGVALIAVETLVHLFFPEAHGFLKFALTLTHELGMASIVAGTVSLIYDIRYHHSNFSKHVQRAASLTKALSVEVKDTERRLRDATTIIEEKLTQVQLAVRSSEEKLKKATEDMESQMDDVKGSVKQFNQVIRFALQERVVGMYHRVSAKDSASYSDELRDKIIYAINHADSFLYLMGRAFDDSIYQKDTPLWLWQAIENKLKKCSKESNPFAIRFILGNAFEESSQLIDEYKHRGSRTSGAADGSDFVRANRNVVRFLLENFDKVENYKKIKPGIRLLNFPPPCFMLITEDRLFVEQYLPYRKPGETVVLEILRGADKDRRSHKHILEAQDELIRDPEKLLSTVMANPSEVEPDSYMAHLKCFELLWSRNSKNLAREIRQWMERNRDGLARNPLVTSMFRQGYLTANKMDPDSNPQIALSFLSEGHSSKSA